MKANPEDNVVPGQIQQVEKYILQYNDKQMPTICKIREIVSTVKSRENGPKSSDEDSEIKNEDIDKAISEEEILESLGLKDVARTSDGKIDHAKLTMKDRMAIVRGMRKKRKRILNGTKKSSPSPGSDETGEDVTGEDESNTDDPAIEQYKGFVTENEPFDAEPPELYEDNDDLMEFEKKRRRLETDLENCDKNQFLCNLNLFTPVDVSSITKLMNEDNQKKLNFRNLTYIPELSDKKHKISYTYLAPDINSPPLLRTRQRRSQPETAVSSRLTSRSNSRATTPERSITRQLSSASTESENMSRKEEKSGLESELSGLTKRHDELQSVLAANKRTISTRVIQFILSFLWLYVFV